MKKLFCAAAQLAALLLFVGIPMFPGDADAWPDDHLPPFTAGQKLACYAWTGQFPNTRTKIALPSHSDISEPSEEAKFGHPHQHALPALGKTVTSCELGDSKATVGTMITTSPEGQPFQAHLGLHTFATENFPHTCKDFEITCKAGKEAGFPPPVWDCQGQNKFNIEFLPFQLVQVVEDEDELCSRFKDGETDAIGILKVGPAPGRATP